MLPQPLVDKPCWPRRSTGCQRARWSARPRRGQPPRLAARLESSQGSLIAASAHHLGLEVGVSEGLFLKEGSPGEILASPEAKSAARPIGTINYATCEVKQMGRLECRRAWATCPSKNLASSRCWGLSDATDKQTHRVVGTNTCFNRCFPSDFPLLIGCRALKDGRLS